MAAAELFGGCAFLQPCLDVFGAVPVVPVEVSLSRGAEAGGNSRFDGVASVGSERGFFDACFTRDGGGGEQMLTGVCLQPLGEGGQVTEGLFSH